MTMTDKELKWCEKLEKVLQSMPETLEVYAALHWVKVFERGTHHRYFEERGDFDNLCEKPGYEFQTRIFGNDESV